MFPALAGITIQVCSGRAVSRPAFLTYAFDQLWIESTFPNSPCITSYDFFRITSVCLVRSLKMPLFIAS